MPENGPTVNVKQGKEALRKIIMTDDILIMYVMHTKLKRLSHQQLLLYRYPGIPYPLSEVIFTLKCYNSKNIHLYLLFGCTRKSYIFMKCPKLFLRIKNCHRNIIVRNVTNNKLDIL